MTFRVRYQLGPVHVYCRLFVAPRSEHTFAHIGSFTLRIDEFDALRSAFTGAEFVEDRTKFSVADAPQNAVSSRP
jgi:hypothetical protein